MIPRENLSGAVCGFEFLANSGAQLCAIARKIRLAAHPDPVVTDSRWAAQSVMKTKICNLPTSYIDTLLFT